MYFSQEALNHMSDMELSVGLEAIQQEIQKRQEVKKKALIEKFHEVWKEMRLAKITIQYEEIDEEMIELYDWSCFRFE